MPTLSEYLVQTRRILKDPNGATYDTTDLTAYINEGRSQCALETECVRYLWAYDAAQTYTLNGTATVGSPVITGLLSTAAVNFGDRAVGQLGGSAAAALAQGAFVINKAATTITLNAPAIASAVGPLTLAPQIATRVGQEVYPYGVGVDLPNGYLNVIQVKGIAVNWGGPLGTNLVTLQQWSFSKYQGYLGYYGTNLLGQPSVWARYGTTARMRPIPSSPLPMQWDTVCTPIPLASDTTPDVVPAPFIDAIKYHAAWLALLGAQRKEDAQAMFATYEVYAKRANSMVQRTMVPNVYG